MCAHQEIKFNYFSRVVIFLDFQKGKKGLDICVQIISVFVANLTWKIFVDFLIYFGGFVVSPEKYLLLAVYPALISLKCLTLMPRLLPGVGLGSLKFVKLS